MLVPLIVRSSYSLQRGVVQPSEWAAAAKAAGLTRLALTDRNGLYGVPTFMEACGKAGLSPLCGLELVYAGGRCVFIPRKKPGFSLLTRLLTERSADPAGFDARAAVAKALGGNNRGELFILTDDEVILAAIPPQEALFALATPCNKTKWRRLAASGHQALASPELSFLERGQREIQRLLLAIGGNCAIHDIGDGLLDPPEALWSSASLGEANNAAAPWAAAPWAASPALAPWLEIAFEANGFVAREALDEPFSGFVFPRFGMGRPAGRDAAPDLHRSSSALLRALVIEGAARRYPLVTDEVRKRIDYELDLIESKGFSDYFLVVRDIARRASRICGRGSAAASIVAYCLGITEVDPIRHSLYFERFLNPGRKDPPDIDVDFAWDERDALFDEVIEAYGPEHAARVANHNCFRSRSALRETARAFGMPDAEISAFERSLKVDSDGTFSSADPAWKVVAKRASSIVGLPRHLGTHSGGLIIVPDLLADHAPIETTGSGIRVIAWDKEGAELAGLVKIDLLGNRSLAVVRDAIADIRGSGRSFDTDTWRPIDDPDTIALLSRGDTMGVFYVESPAMRLLQIKTGKGDFGHLVIHSSIIRPAANRYIDEYVDRLNGKSWSSFHPLLKGLFDESYGILCYQEDVSKAAIALAGFSAAEADGIRKILSKKDAETRLQEYRGPFFAGARARGVDEASIEAVWAMICSFSGYSFVKAHSASYAMLSFQSAYLRAHFPAEFMAAVLSNHGGFYSTLAYASESRRMGLALFPPDVNESGWRCAGGKGVIRFGFCMVVSLNAGVAETIPRERERRGAYRSVEDFARRVGFERTDAEALVGSGAFDSLLGGSKRSDALMTLLSMCAAREGGAAGAPRELFELEVRDPVQGEGRGAGRKRRAAELKYLGTTLDSHPLELWPRALAQPRTRAADLRRMAGRRVLLLGWPITAKPVLTATEEPMEFVSFEDETAIFEAVLFPEAFRKFRHLLFEEHPLWIRGLVENNRGATTLTIEEMRSAV